MKHRELFTSEIKALFDLAVRLIMHWDRKIMKGFTGPSRERVDHLPILVSGQNLVKLLSVPKLQDVTAVTMMNTVENMDEWGLRNHIIGLCFDAAALNTRTKGRVCILLEKVIGRELPNLACLHYIGDYADKCF